MSPAVILDHTALIALHQADPFFAGLYVETSRGTGRLLLPALSLLAAERAIPGAGTHAAALRYAEQVSFTTEHVVTAAGWPESGWAVTHPAAIAWQAARAGENAVVLSLEPGRYAGTGVTPLDPT